MYSTPSDQLLEFEIADPRGVKVKEDKIKLNAFGSAWGSLELTGNMPLGEFHVTFWDEGRKHSIGNATLFRLEEYKLPEFKVGVQTPEAEGKKKAFRLGEKVEVNIQADYYFGGPVNNANVEVLVYQNPFYHYWHRSREFPWFYEDMDSQQGRWGRWYGGQGQIVKRETLKTDASGKASLTFDTPKNAGQDFEYRIEARVTDASAVATDAYAVGALTQVRWLLSATASAGLAFRMASVSRSMSAPVFDYWLTAEAGYHYSPSYALALNSGGPRAADRKVQPLALGDLSLRGGFARLGVALTF